MKPNISQIDTERLSEKAFLLWLLEWADEECAQYDAQLHGVAQDFVRLLLDEGPEYPIKNIFLTGRGIQVNEQYFIIIENKADIDKHRKPLEYYTKTEYDYSEYLREKVWLVAKLICLDSPVAVKGDKAADDYKVMNRKQILASLGRANVTNERFRQFVDCWEALEGGPNSCAKNIPLNQSIVQDFFPELSINSFFTWLLQWADEERAQSNATLCAVAQNFVRLLLGKGPEYSIEKIIIYENTSAEINGQYFIIIRSIRDINRYYNPSAHYDEYTSMVNRRKYEKKVWIIPKLVYLKTLDDSPARAKDFSAQGYRVIDLKEILASLNEGGVTDERFRHFVDYWAAIEDGASPSAKLEDLTSSQSITQAFCSLLSERKFFIWLLKWANEKCAQHDTALHAVAQNFIRVLVNEGPEYPIKKVETKVVMDHIHDKHDKHYSAEVNEHYFIIIIDDKGNMDQNFDPLQYSKEVTESHGREDLVTKLIYLDTDIEATTNDYKVINCKQILTKLNATNVTNDTFRQFVDHWAEKADGPDSLS